MLGPEEVRQSQTLSKSVRKNGQITWITKGKDRATVLRQSRSTLRCMVVPRRNGTAPRRQVIPATLKRDSPADGKLAVNGCLDKCSRA